jgi:hypothetical protein
VTTGPKNKADDSNTADEMLMSPMQHRNIAEMLDTIAGSSYNARLLQRRL